MSGPESIADDLAAAARACLAGLEPEPDRALGTLVERIAGDILPRLRARAVAGDGGERQLDLELSELASTISIVAAGWGIRRRTGAGVRLARRHVTRLLDLAAAIAEAERALGGVPVDAGLEDRARSKLFFVAPPDRPATEAHVLRHTPRPAKVWSPARPQPRAGPPQAMPLGR